MDLNGDLLVVVFLRGGCDAINMLSPLDGDDRKVYEEERPNLKIAASGPAASLKISDHLGLHPSAKPLLELFEGGHLAVVQAVGMPSNNRSHFDSQAYMELGTPDKKGTASGWIARHLLSTLTDKNPSPFTAINIGPLAPTSFLSFDHNISIVQPNRFNFINGDKNVQQDALSAMHAMYNTDGVAPWLDEVGQETLRAVEVISSQKNGEYVASGGADYPKGEVGNRLRTAAQLIKMDLGLRVATVDMGGWDTHKFQGQGVEGTFAKNVEQLSQALHAFYSDMTASGRSKNLTAVVMTEFGRRLRENANRGTDHGHGGFMFVLGDKVNGKKVYGKWPGLKTEQLYERADLFATTDYRSVLAEVLQKRLGNKKIATVFPEFKATRLGICTV